MDRKTAAKPSERPPATPAVTRTRTVDVRAAKARALAYCKDTLPVNNARTTAARGISSEGSARADAPQQRPHPKRRQRSNGALRGWPREGRDPPGQGLRGKRNLERWRAKGWPLRPPLRRTVTGATVTEPGTSAPRVDRGARRF